MGRPVIDILMSGKCSECRAAVTSMMRVLGDAPGGLRWVSHDFDCAACGLKVGWTRKERRPDGVA